MGDADDDDLAQPPVELDLEPRRADELEPDGGQRRRMQKQLIDIDQRPTPSGADFADQVGELGVVVFLDVGDAGHDASGCSGTGGMADIRIRRCGEQVKPTAAWMHIASRERFYSSAPAIAGTDEISPRRSRAEFRRCARRAAAPGGRRPSARRRARSACGCRGWCRLWRLGFSGSSFMPRWMTCGSAKTCCRSLIGPAGMPAASSLSRSSSRFIREVSAQSLPTSSARCASRPLLSL